MQTRVYPFTNSMLHCLDQMLAVMKFGQHRVSTSRTVKPCIPVGARCVEHVRIT